MVQLLFRGAKVPNNGYLEQQNINWLKEPIIRIHRGSGENWLGYTLK